MLEKPAKTNNLVTEYTLHYHTIKEATCIILFSIYL